MRFRYLFLAAAAALCAVPAHAQTFNWVQSRPFAATFNPDYVQAQATPTPDGGAWWADPETHTSHTSFMQLGHVRLSRLRADGRVAFSRVLRGQLAIIDLKAAPGPAGGVLLLGQYRDSARFDGTQVLVNPHPNSGVEFFLARLDSSGAFQWSHTLQVPRDQLWAQQGESLTLDNQGQPWVAYGTFIDSYATRFNAATGDSLTSIVQEEVAQLSSVAVAPDGTVYTAGSCANPGARWNGTVVTDSLLADYNYHIACYTPGGALRWVRLVAHVTCLSGWVATNDTTGVYFVGAPQGGATFGPFTVQGGSMGQSVAVTRLDRATGTFQWLRQNTFTQFGSSATPALEQPLALDAAGNAWVLATAQGTNEWAPGVTFTAPPQGNCTLLAYDRQGTLLAATASTGSTAVAHGLRLDAATNHGIVTGLARYGAAGFGALAALPATPRNVVLPFTVGFDASLTVLGVAPAPVASRPAATLAPNPAAPGSRVTVGNLPTGNLPATAALFDNVGRLVATCPLTAGLLALPATLLPGVYTVRLSGASGSIARPLVVQ